MFIFLLNKHSQAIRARSSSPGLVPLQTTGARYFVPASPLLMTLPLFPHAPPPVNLLSTLPYFYPTSTLKKKVCVDQEFAYIPKTIQ